RSSWWAARSGRPACRSSRRPRTSAIGSARSWRNRAFSNTDARSPSGPVEDGTRQVHSGRLVFLGGVGEIGRNMACLELEGRILVIDCGLSFPRAELPGIDLVLPDFEYLRQNADRLE